ncbi:molybdopterin synthase subunit MoaD [Kribbella amoyensis]|uniref:Molybdopterin synthase subunit MoaD n=1 Tax=Kribbella amoyensis TaxID=996641 RepID=A0A561B943_9ACTN|nr:ubiquitin-like small modifier protein 1 [Kribbella amoyensis]TWD75380.1 molybdopterin synthase subunit MoaD [Kribbella amoyensis]
MTVAVKIPTVLRPFAGGAECVRLDLDGDATVGAVFAQLEQDHPALRRRLTDDQGELRRHVNVFLAGDNIRDLKGLHTPLPDGAELLILPSVAGG